MQVSFCVTYITTMLVLTIQSLVSTSHYPLLFDNLPHHAHLYSQSWPSLLLALTIPAATPPLLFLFSSLLSKDHALESAPGNRSLSPPQSRTPSRAPAHVSDLLCRVLCRLSTKWSRTKHTSPKGQPINRPGVSQRWLREVTAASRRYHWSGYQKTLHGPLRTGMAGESDWAGSPVSAARTATCLSPTTRSVHSSHTTSVTHY